MDVYKLEIKKIRTVAEAVQLFEEVADVLDTLYDDMYYDDSLNITETKRKAEYLERLIHRIRVRKYELMKPELSDGIVDLYCDHDAHFTITEHDKKIPIGSIAYHKTKNPIPGNIAYEVLEEYQGHHYALRALRLLGKRLLDNGVQKIFITASNNRNYPSMRTIESFGGILYRGGKNIPGPVAYSCDLSRIYSNKKM